MTATRLLNATLVIEETHDLRLIGAAANHYPLSHRAWLTLLSARVLLSYDRERPPTLARVVEALRIVDARVGPRPVAEIAISLALTDERRRRLRLLGGRARESQALTLAALAYVVRCVEEELLPLRRGKIDAQPLQARAEPAASRPGRPGPRDARAVRRPPAETRAKVGAHPALVEM
jgi:hypothetical protein